MNLNELLQQLAQKYPEKWWWSTARELLLRVSHDEQALNPDYYSTEDCIKILKEHNLVMWVEPSDEASGMWVGFYDPTWPTGEETSDPIGHCDTQFNATEATFRAALEYIIDKKKE